jgi:hypothetical protein
MTALGDISITVADEILQLLPERAIFVPRTQTLYAADLHWGKEHVFGARGIPLPNGVTNDDLLRLDNLLRRTQAARLIILGDLIHARESLHPQVVEAVTAWRDNHGLLQVQVVRGNHDRHIASLPAAWGFAMLEQPIIEPPFALLHQPQSTPNLYTLAGHLHPAVVMMGQAKQRLKLPCFWFGKNVGVLPAFGSFIENALITPPPNDRVFVALPDRVMQVR